MLFGHVAALVELGQNSYRAARTEIGREGRLGTLLGHSAFGPGMALPAPFPTFPGGFRRAEGVCELRFKVQVQGVRRDSEVDAFTPRRPRRPRHRPHSQNRCLLSRNQEMVAAGPALHGFRIP